LCLGYLSSLEDREAIGRCQQQMESADNMTDEFAALSCLAGIPGADGDQALKDFYGKWQQDDLVVDKWLGVQAGACRSDTCERVEVIRRHSAFDIANPNKARALIRVFLRNLSSFHRADGAGYRWVADRVLELDKLNPQIAARMAGAFSSWRRFDQDRQELMKVELERILAADKLSKDLFEIASKTINS
jgi:aminopeptidase N